MLPVVLAVLSCSPAAQKAADPEFKGFDYRAVHRDVITLVAEGKAREAVEMLDGRDALRKEFALYFGAGGKFLGQEVVGYKRLTSRIYKFYAVGHWEKKNAVFTCELAKGADGTWRISTLGLTPKLDELEKVAAFVPLGPARD